MIIGLVGKDLKYSLSKKIHEMLNGNSYELLSFPTESKVKDFFKTDFGFVNVTIPYKTLATESVDELSKIAKETHTVNLVVNRKGKLQGFNTDAYGFAYLLDKYRIKVESQDCLIFGTGATSRTVKYVLSQRGAKSVKFLSREPVENDEYSYNDLEVIEKANIIINTTPVGTDDLKAKNLIDFANAKSCQFFIDVVYKPLKSNMVLSAKEHGIKAYGGLAMLVGQAVRTNELFYGKKYNKSDVDEIYKKVLISTANLVLIGHPFSGKTTISTSLARELILPWIDIDAEIVRRENGISIQNIFEEKGEGYFRDAESAIIEEYSSKVGYILSLGAGAVLNKKNMDLLVHNSLIFNIKRDIDSIDEKSMFGRPLTRNKKELEKIIKNRAPLYEKYQDYTIDSASSINDAVELIRRSIWSYL